MENNIRWYDAKNLHPARECEVVVMTRTDSGKLCTVISVSYKDGCFNGRESRIDVVCWAYKEDFERTFEQFTKGDDF